MQLINNFNSTTSVIQVGSRIIWSFARDGGFIFPKYFATVNPKLACPVPAVVMSWVIAALVSILYLASTTAFNALLSCLVVLAYFAYGVPIVCLLLRGRVYDREGTFKLGRFGWAINIAAVCFMSFLAIFFCFPVYLPATKTNMSKFLFRGKERFELNCHCRLRKRGVSWVFGNRSRSVVRCWQEELRWSSYAGT